MVGYQYVHILYCTMDKTLHGSLPCFQARDHTRHRKHGFPLCTVVWKHEKGHVWHSVDPLDSIINPLYEILNKSLIGQVNCDRISYLELAVFQLNYSKRLKSIKHFQFLFNIVSDCNSVPFFMDCNTTQ